MPTIEKRTVPDGAVSYRVKVRLKGFRSESETFARVTDAKRWAQQTEAAMRRGAPLQDCRGEAPYARRRDRPLHQRGTTDEAGQCVHAEGAAPSLEKRSRSPHPRGRHARGNCDRTGRAACRRTSAARKSRASGARRPSYGTWLCFLTSSTWRCESGAGSRIHRCGRSGSRRSPAGGSGCSPTTSGLASSLHAERRARAISIHSSCSRSRPECAGGRCSASPSPRSTSRRAGSCCIGRRTAIDGPFRSRGSRSSY